LGVVCEKQTRYADAKDYFTRALEVNPTLWSAYEKLGKLGDHVNPGKVFSDTKLKSYETAQLKKPNTPLSAKRKK
jgi:tetratricopeptide (TPR) repeat protein